MVALMAAMTTGYCQSKPATKTSNVKVEKIDAKTFKATKSSSSRGNSYQPTGYYYIDTDGNKYEIYSHVVTKGNNAGKTQYYIQRTSKKSGKTYWKKVEITL